MTETAIVTAEVPAAKVNVIATALRRLIEVQRWLNILDVALKVGALMALLAAARYFFLRADIRLVANSARFVDAQAVQDGYTEYGRTVPTVVLDAIYDYELRNLRDLRDAENTTLVELPRSELCARDAAFLEGVFGAGECEKEDEERLGRGAFYERKLVDLALDTPELALTPADVRFALGVMRRSEYRRYRVCVRNVGDFRATDVAINPSTGYQIAPGYSPQNFSLRKDEESIRDFVTEIGYLDAQPRATVDFVSSDAAVDAEAVNQYARPGSEIGSSLPESSCLGKPGATDATFFTVDWQDNPGRPTMLVVVLVFGSIFLVIMSLLFIGKVKQ